MSNYDRTQWVNNETVVDAKNLNKIEKQLYLLTESSITNSERLEVVEDLIDTKIEDVNTTETDDGTLVKFIANGNIKKEIIVQGGNSVKIQPEAPSNLNSLWVDTDDDDVDATFGDSVILEEFRNSINNISKIVEKLDYTVRFEMDAGYFDDDIEESDEVLVAKAARVSDNESDNEEELPLVLQGPKTDKEEDRPEWLEESNGGKINILKIKRGLKKYITNGDYKLKEGELGFCMDTEELYIGNKGLPRLIAGGTSGGSGGGNLTGKYVELEAPDGSKYRLGINEDGDIKVLSSLVDTATDPSKTEASKYAGLIIRHVYGGGRKNRGDTICSHSFIELYNNTPYSINLKGLSVQCAGNGEPWNSLALRGYVKPYHSFLIRCAQLSDINKPNVKFKITDYDMHWDIEVSDKGYKIYLGVGTEPITNTNPFNINGAGMKEPGYIDLFCVGGITEADNGTISRDFHIDACENNYPYIANKNYSAERKCNTKPANKQAEFMDTDDNFYDIRAVDLREALTSVHTPRPSTFGRWDSYYDKMVLTDVPQMINMCYGEDGNTTRTWTWQTLPTRKGYLKYKKVGESKWNVIESTKKVITHPDTDATVHSVIVRGLTPGKYVYQVGSNALWTDEIEFEVKAPTNQDLIKMLHVTDQQCWTEEEYSAWGIIYKMIEEKEKDWDFCLNTGDISQNGGGHAFEWRYYYDFAPGLSNRCHMTTCGNNDLTYNPETDRKEDPTAFTWYTTVENAPQISCHSWNYGYIHFVCINSNVMEKDSEIARKQVEWVREDLAKPENQKRWKIVYMHEPVYAHVRSALLDCFITPFAEGGVDLVLGGHHHRYTRSKRMGALGPNKENNESPTGFYCVMPNATGYKLAGKTKPADNNHEYMEVYDDTKIPNYIMWDISYDNIKMHSYKVHDLVPFEDHIGHTPYIREFDTLTITK